MRRYIRLTMLLLTFLCIGTARAQQLSCNINLTVRVTEAHTAAPLDGATLTLASSDTTLAADKDGLLHAANFCPGEQYHLIVAAAGFTPASVFITLSADTLLSVALSHTGKMLEGVIVSHTRSALIPLQAGESLNTAALRNASGRSLTDALQGITGVSSFNTGASVAKPIIHGLHSNRILTLNNGIRQEDQQWGGEHAPNIDPYAAGSVTVLKGAAAVRYGADALGGVILVEPEPLRTTPGTSGEVNAGAFSNNRMGVVSAAIEHAFLKMPALAVRVQGTWRQGGNYRIPHYWAANTGIRELDGSVALQYHGAHAGAELWYSHFSTDIGIYRGSHTGSRGDFLAAIASDTPRVPADFTYDLERPRQHVTHDLIKLRAHADSRYGTLSATYGFQDNFRQEYDVLRKENGRAQLNLSLYTHTLNLALDHHRWKGFTGTIGIDGIYQQNTFENGDRVFIPVYYSPGLAAYLIERWRKKDWLLEGGLRYDLRWYEMINAEGSAQTLVHYTFRYNNPSVTLGAEWKPAENKSLKAIFSTGWRPPQAAELFSAGLHGGAARVEIGDKSLRPERSLGLNLEGRYADIPANLHLDGGVYAQYIADYIYLEPGPDLLTIRGYYKTFLYRQTNALLYGADVSASYDWSPHFNTTFKGSTVFGRDVTKRDWLFGMTSDRATLSIRYTARSGKAFRDSYAELSGRGVGRQVRIPKDFDSVDYPRPPAGYFLLNAAIGTTAHLRKQPFEISIAVTNALNVRYRDYLDAFRYFIDAPGTDVALRLRVPLSF